LAALLAASTVAIVLALCAGCTSRCPPRHQAHSAKEWRPARGLWRGLDKPAPPRRSAAGARSGSEVPAALVVVGLGPRFVNKF